MAPTYSCVILNSYTAHFGTLAAYIKVMKHSNRFYILIIVIVLGGIFQAFKSINLDTDLKKPTDVTSKELKNFKLEPFHITKVEEQENKNIFAPSRNKHTKISKKKYDFAKSHSFGKIKKKPKKAKKKVTKKKKAKNKTPKGSVKTAKKSETDKNEDNFDQDTDLNIPEDSAPAVGGIFPTDNNNDDIPQTAEEWIQKLLVFPSYKKVVQFINTYQSRLISANVFYEVLTAMAEDSREEVNVFAVRSAGSTPSPQSFIFITTVIDEPTLSSKVRNLAKGQLLTYKSLQYLVTLRTVILDSEYPYAKTLAANMVAQSAKLNLTNEQDVSSLDENTPDRDTAAVSTPKVRKNYELTKEILAGVLNLSETDNSLASALNEAINAINAALS